MGTPATVNDGTDTLNDRQLLERVCKQLDHLDQRVHELAQQEQIRYEDVLNPLYGQVSEIRRLVESLEPLIPHIPRALALLDPMAKLRGRAKERKGYLNGT